MSIGSTVTRTCKTCGIEFPHAVKGPGRHPDYCPPHAAERSNLNARKYRQGDKYRKRMQVRRETYDPWLWENTILEWNE